jgi:hypothetical protein
MPRFAVFKEEVGRRVIPLEIDMTTLEDHQVPIYKVCSDLADIAISFRFDCIEGCRATCKHYETICELPGNKNDLNPAFASYIKRVFSRKATKSKS